MRPRFLKGLLAVFMFLLLGVTPVGALDEASCSLDDSCLGEVPKRSGTYFISLDSEGRGEVAGIKVRIMVKGPNTVVNRNLNEAIDGLDFKLNPGIISELSSEDFIQYADAHAWDTMTGAVIPVVGVRLEKSSERFYHIYFATESGTETVVSVIEQASTVSHFEDTIIKVDEAYKLNAQTIFASYLVMFATPLFFALIAYFTIRKKLRDTERIVYSSFNQD